MTINQHYIPQFYQKFWECEQKGYIWEFDKRHINNADKGIRKQAIRKRNSQEYLYEADVNNPDNATEKWYSNFETKYSVLYKKLIDNRAYICRITEDEKKLICKIFAHFSARNPINLYHNRGNNAMAAMYTLGIEDKDVDRRSIQNLIAFSEAGMYEIFGGKEEILGEFEEKLRLCNLQLLFSDKPNIVFCNNLIKQIGYVNEYYFPISPYILAFFTYADSYEDKIIRKITDEEYGRFVRLYMRSIFIERIYSSSEKVLKEILSCYK